MQQLVDDSVFRQVESFLLENHKTESGSQIDGLGIKYDLDSLEKIRQFVNKLHKKYQGGTSVQSGQNVVKGLSQDKVEQIYREATGSSLSYQEIMKQMKVLTFFLNEAKYQSSSLYQDLITRVQKFIRFLKQLKETDMGKQQTALIKKVEQKFKQLNDSLEFYLQDSTGFKEDHGDIEDVEYDFTEELNSHMRLIAKTITSISIVEKNGFPKLLDKYLHFMKQDTLSIKETKQLMKLVKLFPIYIESKYLTSDEIRDLLSNITSFVLLSSDDDIKRKFVQKIKIIFQKATSQNMEGGRNTRLLNEHYKQDYKKKMVIEIFRSNIQGFYAELLINFKNIVDQQYVKSINMFSGDLRSVITELRDVLALIKDSSYIEQDLREFVSIIRNPSTIDIQSQQKDGLRLKFQFIKQDIQGIIDGLKQNPESNSQTNSFIGRISDIQGVIQKIVNYLKKLEDKDFDITEDDISTYQSDQKYITGTDNNEIDKLLDFIHGFITASHMAQNLKNTKELLNTVNLDKYQDDSISIFNQAARDMSKYYKDLHSLYNSNEVQYNPTLALYVKDILLKFHSCLYISNGISDCLTLNPRYINNMFSDDGRYLQYTTLFTGQSFRIERGADTGFFNIANTALRHPLVPPGAASTAIDIGEVGQEHKRLNFVGITEELGCGMFKSKEIKYTTENLLTVDQLPTLPAKLEQLKTVFGENTIKDTRDINDMYSIFDILDLRPNNVAARATADIVGDITTQLVNVDNAIFSPQQKQRITGLLKNLKGAYTQEFGVDLITQQNELLQYITRMVAIKIGPKILPAGNPVQAQSCFNNDALKEYLIPQIQVPYIQPFTKLFQLNFNMVNYNKLHTDVVTFTSDEASNHWYIRSLNLTYQAAEELSATRSIYVGGNLKPLSEHQPIDISQNMYNCHITSMLGLQSSTPVMYTPTGIFGQRLQFRQPETFTKIQNLRTTCDTHIWSLFDRVDRNYFYQHSVGTSATLLLDNFDDTAMEGFRRTNQHSTFLPLDHNVTCISGHPAGAPHCTRLDCPVFKSTINQLFEYQLYMSQHLQYFGLQGSIAIFDPLVRSRLFQISNDLYQGKELLTGLTNIALKRNDALAGNLIQDYLVERNIFYNTSRPFGNGRVVTTDRPFVPRPGGAASPVYQEFLIQMGNYKNIPENFIYHQPRVGVPILLQKCVDNLIRNKFIDKCDAVNAQLVENGILRVTKNTIDQVLKIIDSDHQMRIYLSTCIQVQYHNNFMFMQSKGQQIKDTVRVSQTNNVQDKEYFMNIVRRVIDIKKAGIAAVILLADFVNKSINNQINKFVSKQKIEYSQILDQLNQLILIYRQEQPRGANSYLSSILTDAEISILLNNNSYLNNYYHFQRKQTNFHNPSHQILGGNQPSDFKEYFQVLEKYLNGLRNIPQNMSIVENFASLFVLVANHEGSTDITKDTIKRYISEYLISSMIDINESLIDLDFDISLQTVYHDQNNDDQQNLSNTQLVVDTREGKQIKLISPDCIFIPVSNSGQNNTLVPQFESQITRDFDQLFNYVISAMCQRMINHIGMYKVGFKKQIDRPVQFSRVMFGVGKSRKNKSQDKFLTNKSSSFQLVDTSKEFQYKDFSLYFRVFLLLKYYQEFFNEINKQLNDKYQQFDKLYIIFHFKPDGSSPIGKLFKIACDDQSLTSQFDYHSIRMFIEQVDRIRNKHKTTSNDDIYQMIVRYVNKNYGIISNIDEASMTALKEQTDKFNNNINLTTFLTPTEESTSSLNSVDPRLSSLNNLIQQKQDQRDDMFINIKYIIEITVDRLTRALSSVDNHTIGTIQKYLKEQYDLLVMSKSSKEKFIDALQSMMNNYRNQKLKTSKNQIISHEQLLFGFEILRNLDRINHMTENVLKQTNYHQIQFEQVAPIVAPGQIRHNKLALDSFIDDMTDIQQLRGFDLANTIFKQDVFRRNNQNHHMNLEQFMESVQTVNYKHLHKRIVNLADYLDYMISQQKVQTDIERLFIQTHYEMNDNTGVLVPATFDMFKNKIKDIRSQYKQLLGRGTFPVNISPTWKDTNINTTFTYNPKGYYFMKRGFFQGPLTQRWHPRCICVEESKYEQETTCVCPCDRCTKVATAIAGKSTEVKLVACIKANTCCPCGLNEKGKCRKCDNIKEYCPIHKTIELTAAGNCSECDKDEVKSFITQLGLTSLYTTGDEQKVFDMKNLVTSVDSKSGAITPKDVKIDLNNVEMYICDDLEGLFADEKDFQTAKAGAPPTKYAPIAITQASLKTGKKNFSTVAQTDIAKHQTIRKILAETDPAVVTRLFGNLTYKQFKEDYDLLLTYVPTSSVAQTEYLTQAGDALVLQLMAKNDGTIIISNDSSGSTSQSGKVTKIEGGGKMKIKGGSLGQQVQVGINHPNVGKLGLTRQFFNNYLLNEGQQQDNHDIFVFNRIFKDYMTSCMSITNHQDFLGRLFFDALSEHKGILYHYKQKHDRIIEFKDIKELMKIHKPQLNQNVNNDLNQIRILTEELKLAEDLHAIPAPGGTAAAPTGRNPQQDTQYRNLLTKYTSYDATTGAVIPGSIATIQGQIGRQLKTLKDRINVHDNPYPMVNVQTRIGTNKVEYSDLVEYLLYDGHNTQLDMFNDLDIELHNDKQLGDKLGNVSLFTSSIYNFFMHWMKQQEDTRIQQVDVLTQLNMKMTQEELAQLVCNSLFTKLEMVTFVEKLQYKQKLIQQVSQNLRKQLADNRIDTDTFEISQYLNTRYQLLTRLERLISNRMIPALDIIISNKEGAIPQMLQSSKDASKSDILLSNMIYLIDIKHRLENIALGHIQSLTDQQKLIFGRYIYTMLYQRKQSHELLQSSTQRSTITQFNDLIFQLVKMQISLQNSKLNREGIYAKEQTLLYHLDTAIPQPQIFNRMLTMNPEQSRNILLPLLYLIDDNAPINGGQTVVHNNKFRKYVQYLDANRQEISNIICDKLEFFIELQGPPNTQTLRRYPAFQVTINNDVNGQQYEVSYKQLIRLSQAVAPSFVYPMKHLMPRLLQPQMQERCLLIQRYRNLDILQATPNVNPRIYEDIMLYINGDVRGTGRILEMNIVDLGIMPINLQMLKKDAGLVNLAIYASTYEKYLNNHMTTDLTITEQIDITRNDYNLQKVSGYLNQVPATIPELQVIQHILTQSKILSKNTTNLITKEEQFKSNLQYQIAFLLSQITQHMLYVDVSAEREVRLKGIETLLQGQFIQSEPNSNRFI